MIIKYEGEEEKPDIELYLRRSGSDNTLLQLCGRKSRTDSGFIIAIIDQQYHTVALHAGGVTNLGLKIGPNW